MLLEIPDPWGISESLFPQDRPIPEQMVFLLNYAALAPSSHNSQPWLFRIQDEQVELYADRTRALPVVDPMDRELVMSCGAALFHLRIALRHFGRKEEVRTHPDPELPDLLARLAASGPYHASAEEHALFRAIPLRRTIRMPFDGRPMPEALLAQLQAAAAEEGACLHVAEGRYSRSAVADLVEEGDQQQWSDEHFRRELAAWVHPSRSLSRDGMPGYALGMPDLLSYFGPLAMRTFDLGKGRGTKDRQLVMAAPALVVLSTVVDTPPAWLAAGQALDRVLLQARAEGAYASFFNQPIEVPELRPRLAEIVGSKDIPQILLRLGYSKDVRPTPRRSVSQFLLPSP
jgi:hypothetical protein